MTFAPKAGRDIAIIGAGFSGSLLALHLLKLARPRDRIHLIERASAFGQGLAYRSGNPNHLLNVRAGNMSAWPERPDHFVEWLRASSAARHRLVGGAHAGAFAPRGLYGAYIQEQLAESLAVRGQGARLLLVNDCAVAVRRGENATGKRLAIELAMGQSIAADICVLAIGLPPAAPPSVGIPLSDPWNEAAYRQLDAQSSVLILGTGLTMIDAVISLLDRGHRGPILALSRRGLLAESHVDADCLPTPWPFDAVLSGASLRKLLRAVRAAIRAAAGDGLDWRVVIDGLRPHTQRLWREMPPTERARFLRHLRPWWEVHRHRAAPRAMARIRAAVRGGQLRILAGRIAAASATPKGLAANLSLRGGGEFRLDFAGAFNCMGYACAFDPSADPLLRSLSGAGLARADALGLGLDVAADHALIGADGEAASDLFALGPLTRGAFWEMTAVHDLRLASAVLARRLLEGPISEAPSLPARREPAFLFATSRPPG